MKNISLGDAVMSLDETGRVVSLSVFGSELLPKGAEPRPFLQIGISGNLLVPERAWEENNALTFQFQDSMEVRLSLHPRNGYQVFRVEGISAQADTIVFGPYFSLLSRVIGDVVGVVQGNKEAFGIQALNAKTLSGFPREYAASIDPMAGKAPVSHISVEALQYFESAAFSARTGVQPCSLLQLFCENRRRKREKNVLSFAGVSVPPMADCPDAGISGASFALFCCSRENALKTIGNIEVENGLPHPVIGGEWAKTSRLSMQSYLIAEFNPANFSDLLARTKQAGLKYLYHPRPFENWGHFILRKDCFPHGDASLAEYCRRAQTEEIHIGLHTLSAFTTTADRYVSPVPNKHLAVLGGSSLSEDISEDETKIRVESGKCFRRITTLQTVRVGAELIRFQEEVNGVLSGCERGAWGTAAAAHCRGEKIDLLCDHPYRVFFPDLTLQPEYSRRLGTLFSGAGVSQVSFDGLEGCEATGEDRYALNRFCLDFWKYWGRPDGINDASRLQHNLWHMNTRMNWGEPWGAKMREGMMEDRIRNQDFYRRNLFPRMLGWFLIRKAGRKFEATPPEDIEWALSMAAGFDAGFALSTSDGALRANGLTDELLAAVRNWEGLRMAGAFPDSLREKLRVPESEWHLEKDATGGFLLYPLYRSEPLVCDLLELQPGQPGGADWVFTNPWEKQEYDFRLRVEGYGDIHNPSFTSRHSTLRFACTVRSGQYLCYRAGKGSITDHNYRPLREVIPDGHGVAEAGRQNFSFACGFSGEEGPAVTVQIFIKGEPIALRP